MASVRNDALHKRCWDSLGGLGFRVLGFRVLGCRVLALLTTGSSRKRGLGR